MKYIGRQINVGFGIEAVRGTQVAVQWWQPKTDLSFDDKNETIQDESSIGVLIDSRDSFIVKKFAEWKIGANIEVNQIGYVLLGLLGSVSTSVDSTGAYLHNFTLANSNQIQSLTVGMNDPVLGNISFPLAVVEEMTISAEEWQQAIFKIKMKSKSSKSASHTVSYNVDNKLLARHSVFKLANNLAGLDSATGICLKSFEITFTKNLEEDFCLSNVDVNDFINKQFSIEWSFTAYFDSTALRTIQIDGTKQAVRYELEDTNTIIGASSSPSLRIDLPLVAFTEFSRSLNNDDVVTQTLKFKGLYSMADGEAVSIELVNTKDGYVSA